MENVLPSHFLDTFILTANKTNSLDMDSPTTANLHS